MPTGVPTKLERQGTDRLLIEWSDGQRREYGFQEILDCCPCAICREKRGEPTSHEPIEQPAEQPADPLGMLP
ncbi:MAG: DUF971 domain-containing protein, partial [Planctomycetales bacterium]